MAEFNFEKVRVEQVDGSYNEFNMTQELGFHIFQRAQDVRTYNLGKAIYRGGNVELDESQQGVVLSTAKQVFNFAACMALEKMFKGEL